MADVKSCEMYKRECRIVTVVTLSVSCCNCLHTRVFCAPHTPCGTRTNRTTRITVAVRAPSCLGRLWTRTRPWPHPLWTQPRPRPRPPRTRPLPRPRPSRGLIHGRGALVHGRVRRGRGHGHGVVNGERAHGHGPVHGGRALVDRVDRVVRHGGDLHLLKVDSEGVDRSKQTHKMTRDTHGTNATERRT